MMSLLSPRPRLYDVITSQTPHTYDVIAQLHPRRPCPHVITCSPAVLRPQEPQAGAGVQQPPRPPRTQTQGPGNCGGVQGTRGQGLEQAEVGGCEEDLGGAGGLSAAPGGDSALGGD